MDPEGIYGERHGNDWNKNSSVAMKIASAIWAGVAFQSTSTSLRGNPIVQNTISRPIHISPFSLWKSEIDATNLHGVYISKNYYSIINSNTKLMYHHQNMKVFFKVRSSPEAPLSVSGPKTARIFHFEMNVQRYSPNPKLQTCKVQDPLILSSQTFENAHF